MNKNQNKIEELLNDLGNLQNAYKCLKTKHDVLLDACRESLYWITFDGCDWDDPLRLQLEEALRQAGSEPKQ